MPSVREKACQYSKQGQRRTYKLQYNKLLGNANTLTKWIHPPRRLELLLKNRLGYRRSDMPKAGEEQVSKRNRKSSPGSSKYPSENSSQSSIGKSRPSKSSKDREDSGQNRRGSSASIKRGQSKSPVNEQHNQVADECAKLLNVPLPLGQARQAADTRDKHQAPSAAYLDYHLNQQLRRRKKQIVDTLMAVILECLDKKLEALEEACDGERSSSSSQAPSSGFRSGNQRLQTAGQKRQLHRDDQSDSGNDENGGGRPDRTKKRVKIITEDNLPRFACPFYKYDPGRFKNHRTCCGPGWTQVHRVKEHIKRAHSLPKHQCNRCCRYFKLEDELKAHQRKTTPCPVRELSDIHRDLADGYALDQDLKLQKKQTKKTDEEKWKEWYCILFYLPPDSQEIPSPYHEIHSDSGLHADGSKGERYSNYYECYREKLVPLIHRSVVQEVEKAILDVEDRIKYNVRDRIRGLPAVLHRLIQSIPPPGDDAEGDPKELVVPDNFDPDDIFAELNFDVADSFNFEEINNPVVYTETTGSSGSSSFSDSHGAVASSNTSVDYEAQGQYYTTMKPSGMTLQPVPELLDYNFSGGYL